MQPTHIGSAAFRPWPPAVVHGRDAVDRIGLPADFYDALEMAGLVEMAVIGCPPGEFSAALGDRFQRRAREWRRRWPIVGDVRGLGGMQAIELVKSQESKTPATDETKQITQYCYEHGLITITAGSYSNVIRVLVPLVATNEQMDEGLDVLESALAAVSDSRGAIAQLV